MAQLWIYIIKYNRSDSNIVHHNISKFTREGLFFIFTCSCVLLLYVNIVDAASKKAEITDVRKKKALNHFEAVIRL